MNPSQVANQILYRHRHDLQNGKGTARTLANMLVEAAEAGYAAALVNSATSAAITRSAIATARLRSR